jgi:methanogenic corrinoid protein MtbC1
MQEALASGLAAAEAAAAAVAPPVPDLPASSEPAIDHAERRRQLATALARFDGATAHEIIDRLLAEVTLDTALRDVLLPFLRELGDLWMDGAVTVAQEHFASALIRGRLLGLARDWERGDGPSALLACLPGEGHELGLIAFGLALRSRGWRIAYLGTDTPIETLAEAADDLRPELIAVCALTPDLAETAFPALREIAGRFRVVLGGAAAGRVDLPDGVEQLRGDVVTEAERLTRGSRD